MSRLLAMKLSHFISQQVPGSASSYSVGAHSYTMGEKVAQSASLYSMSSGSSSASGIFLSIKMKKIENKIIFLFRLL